MMKKWRGAATVALFDVLGGLLGCSSEDSPRLGEGPRAVQREELCFKECEVEAACGIESDPACDAYCDRRELGCKADTMSDACFDALVALQECAIGLTCEELLQFRGRVAVAVRPCQAESDSYHENEDCPYFWYSGRSDACNEGD